MKKFFCVIVVLFVFQSASYAFLNLELTRGVDRALPIAVVPFQTPDQTSSAINEVIASDLKLSGQFKLVNREDMMQLPHVISNVDFNYWQDLKVNNLVIGRIASVRNAYQISYDILDVYKKSTALFNKTYTAKPYQLRRVAHHIADDIYEQLLGEKGYFSTKIAYILETRRDKKHIRYSLMIADADGYNAKPILISDNEPIMSPSWAPDGQHVAYVSFEKRRASIYISNIITGKRQLITRAPGINGAPVFSPDGAKLAVALSRGDNPKIFIVDLKTRQTKQITHGWAIDTEPAWAPDGRSLIFTTDRGGRPQIYQVNLSNMKIERLTYEGSYNARAIFTPNGQMLVMMHRDDNHHYRIATQDLNTGAVNLITDGKDDQSPSISPNGRMIIYATHTDEHQVLGMVSIDDAVKLLLPEPLGEVREPAWSPK